MVEGYENLSVLGSVEDLPIMASSRYMDNTRNAQAPIKLTEFIFSMLYHELGDEIFKKAYRDFIRTWAKKSPTPYDLFNTFEKVSAREMDWFWSPWFFRFGNVDVAISSLDKAELTVENEGNKPVALVVDVMYKNGSTWKKDLKASIWKDSDQVVLDIPDYENIKTIDVNNGLPDTNILNNYFPNLKERYGEFDIAPKFLGKYLINEMPFTASIKKKNDLVFLSVKANGGPKVFEAYFIPVSNNKFEDINAEFTMILKEDHVNNDLRLILNSGQNQFTGQK
jgi:hypothetical protein